MCQRSPPLKNHQFENAYTKTGGSEMKSDTMKKMKHRVSWTSHKIPFVGFLSEQFQDLNPFLKCMVFFTVVLWKVYIGYIIFYGVSPLQNFSSSPEIPTVQNIALNTIHAPHSSLDIDSKSTQTAGLVPVHTPENPIRVLHIVTALAEYNNGSRGTERGEDRLQKVFIPVLKNSVESMIAPPYNYEVDVYLVLGWDLKPERRKLIEDALPEGVGLQVWSNATPLGYDKPMTDVKLKPVTRGLARQHRFVIKDKLMYYDLFSVFEDDMRITGGHIHHFLEVSRELERLAEEAPDELPPEHDYPKDKGSISRQLSKKQLKRMMPGLIRTEILLDESKNPSQRELDPIPIDLEFDMEDGSTKEIMFDTKPCCHVPPGLGKMPPNPSGDKAMIWETAVKGTVVRKIPKGGTNFLDWVMLQPGPKNVKPNSNVAGFWSGNLGLYGDMEKPGGGDPRLIAQQGGWLATREQLIEMHLHQCPGGFFPPFEKPLYNQDGLTLNNVEFWSGGFSIFSGTKAGCNMQRVISLKPEHFPYHFIYHTANNKQKSLPNFRLLKTNNFMGQINSVVKAAKKALADQS